MKMKSKLFFKPLCGSFAVTMMLSLSIGCAQQRGSSEFENGIADLSTFYDVGESAEDLRKVQERKGSLWADTYSARLYDNMYRASKVGDIVTIVVSEEAKGTGTGTTKTKRKSEHDASVDTLGGLMQSLTNIISNLNPASLISAKTESKFQGDGSTEREGSLFATITARITKVLSNGNMLVRGEKQIKINAERQVLIVEGLIRPHDIFPNNTISSAAISDARISYSGFGVVAERQRPGWLTRVLDYIWPF